MADEGLSLDPEDETALWTEWRHEAVRRTAVPAPPRLTLDDLPRVSDVEPLLRHLPADVLALALVGAAPAVFDHIAAAMPARRLGLLREAVAAVADAPPETVAQARERVVVAVLALAAGGEVVVAEPFEGDEDDAFVD